MRTARAAAAAALLALGPPACEVAHEEPATLAEALRLARPGDELPVVVRLRGSVDPGAIEAGAGRARPGELARSLRAASGAAALPLRALLARRGVTQVKDLWIVHGLAARVRPAVVRELLSHPAVLEITLDATLRAPAATYAPAAAPAGWNLAAVRAPELWQRGVTGRGVVVAGMDTGVALDHPDLGPTWRGGTNGWLDPFRGTTAPYDLLGHGTQTLSVAVGGSSGGSTLGVAPDARWIAAKIYDDLGRGSTSVIHQAFQWLLDPDGDPATPDAPDVVNASWGSLAANVCDLTFQPDLDALRAAGILVVFAAGNEGPAPLTSVSPANVPGAFSAGAVDSTSAVAAFSSRGPSACTGGTFPDVVAPGVDVPVADLPVGGVARYTMASGTSVAAPHVAGVAALLRSAFPDAPVAEVEDALRTFARDLGPVGPDDTHGHGLVNAARAWAQLARSRSLAMITTSLAPAYAGVAYAQPLAAGGGVPPYAWSAPAGALPPGLALDPAGTVSGTPAASGTFHVTVTVADASGQWEARPFVLTVNGVLPPSVATAALPPAALGAPYQAVLLASGGVLPLTWSLAAGTLPPGLALDGARGVVSGVPTAIGPALLTLRVTDALGATATHDLTLDVGIGALAITTQSLRSCRVGTACSRALAATGGLAPYGWSVATGALPPGLTLDPATGAVAGTPTAAGTFAFTAQVSDSTGAPATRALTMTVL
jgi:subtilisin family serine protease